MLSGVENPDSGTRTEGHQVITQYFAQDEAARLDPTLTVYQTLAGDAPIHMVPHIRNILGGFLFSGDDVDKPVRVLSGGERTRLAVARMLLRPANTLLLDEPTNHLDLDSKDVLLDALEDFGGTLIFVSHDRYFVDKLATKVISIGGGDALLYPGNYEEFLVESEESRHREGRDVGPGSSDPASCEPRMWEATSIRAGSSDPPHRDAARCRTGSSDPASTGTRNPSPPPRTLLVWCALTAAARVPNPVAETPAAVVSYEERKTLESEARKTRKVVDARRKRIDDLETRIAEREQAIRDIEATMAAPGFYDNREEAKPIIDKHQALMWEVAI
jgi:ATP-binding cassette subfamily F protein 3